MTAASQSLNRTQGSVRWDKYAKIWPDAYKSQSSYGKVNSHP